jgi:hypothetical protein
MQELDAVGTRAASFVAGDRLPNDLLLDPSHGYSHDKSLMVWIVTNNPCIRIADPFAHFIVFFPRPFLGLPQWDI